MGEDVLAASQRELHLSRTLVVPAAVSAETLSQLKLALKMIVLQPAEANFDKKTGRLQYHEMGLRQKIQRRRIVRA